MRRFGLVLAVSGLFLVSCGSSSRPAVSAPLLLQKAKKVADSASAVHFVLSSSNVPTTGTQLVGGHGDLERPASMDGTFEVATSGFTAGIKVVSVDGVFEVKLPFSSRFEKANPASFGLSNPAQLLDPASGLTRLLTLAQHPRLGPERRVGGELLDTVSYTVPGRDIPVLPDANPALPVAMTVAIDPVDYQLRTVTLVGPLRSANISTTYVLTLTNYDEHVAIALPSG